MTNKRDRVQRLAFGGLFAALICIFTAYLKLPGPVGYIHLGDGVIFVAAALLGPAAALPAGIGSALADVLAGMPVYVPATLLIKAAMALITALLLRRIKEKRFILHLPIFLLSECLMAAAYFLYQWALFGLAGALAELPFSAVQGAAGMIVGLALVPAARYAVKRLKF